MDFSWILGYARTTFHHSESPVKLPWRDSSSKPLHEVCKSPAITPPCRLAPYLPTGHLQTINSAITKTDVPIHYRRKVFESNDARHSGTFVVDFVSHLDAQTQDKSVGDNDEGRTEPAKIRGNLYCPKRTRLFEDKEWAEIEAGSDDKTPMLVILHGLSGGSYEVYLKQVLAPLTVDCATGQQKWEACVVTARGCAGSAITSGILFNARATWDYRQVVNFLQQKFPKRPLFGLGFSLGANILVNVSDICSATFFVVNVPCAMLLAYLLMVALAYSISGKRASAVSSMRPLYVRTPGISMQAIWLCREHGWEKRSIRKPWDPT